MQTAPRGVFNSTRILKKHWPPASGLTTNKTYTEIFAGVQKKTSPTLVTRVVGNDRVPCQKDFSTLFRKKQRG